MILPVFVTEEEEARFIPRSQFALSTTGNSAASYQVSRSSVTVSNSLLLYLLALNVIANVLSVRYRGGLLFPEVRVWDSTFDTLSVVNFVVVYPVQPTDG